MIKIIVVNIISNISIAHTSENNYCCIKTLIEITIPTMTVKSNKAVSVNK